MDINPQEIKQRFTELSDQALLAVERDQLTELAQEIYDDELDERGLLTPPAPQGSREDTAAAVPQPNLPPGSELVHLATFLDFHDAQMAVSLLRAGEIPATVESEMGTAYAGTGALRLMVPASFAEQAEEILDSEISDEELAAQAEAAGEVDVNPDDDRALRP